MRVRVLATAQVCHTTEQCRLHLLHFFAAVVVQMCGDKDPFPRAVATSVSGRGEDEWTRPPSQAAKGLSALPSSGQEEILVSNVEVHELLNREWLSCKVGA